MSHNIMLMLNTREFRMEWTRPLSILLSLINTMITMTCLICTLAHIYKQKGCIQQTFHVQIFNDSGLRKYFGPRSTIKYFQFFWTFKFKFDKTNIKKGMRRKKCVDFYYKKMRRLLLQKKHFFVIIVRVI